MENFGFDKAQEAGLRVIKLFDTVGDALEDKKIQMDEWFQIGNAGISTIYVFQNAADIKNQLFDIDLEEKEAMVAYWRENANVGGDDEEVFNYALDCLDELVEIKIKTTALVERGKELFAKNEEA